MKIVKRVSIILLLLAGAVCLINYPDRGLRPEVQEILESFDSQRKNAEAGEDNAYFAVLGFSAPEEMDISRIGKRIHDQYYRTITSSIDAVTSSPAAIIGPAPPFPKPIDIPQCSPGKTGCLPYYAQHAEQLPQLLAANTLLLERYGQLKSYPEYQDLMRYSPWSSWADLSRAIYAAHLLSVAEAASLYQQGRRQEAMERVAEDIVLWRKFLAGTADVAGKAFSHLALQRDYSLLDEMAAAFAPEEGEAGVPEAILSPLTKDEKSYGQVIDGYLLGLHWNLAHHLNPWTQMEMKPVNRYFFKPNGTVNEAYAIFDAMKRAADAESARLEEEMTTLRDKIGQAEKKDINWIYNPLGKMFLATSFDGDVAAQWNRSVQTLQVKITALRERLRQR